jgi:hypothetical protein
MLNTRFAPRFAHLRAMRARVVTRIDEKIPNCRNPYFVDVFRSLEKSRATQRADASRKTPHASCALAETQHVVSRRVRTGAIMQKHWFFCRAVVIRMQCSRSPRTLYDIATHSWLGGQHGEEAKIIREDGEKGRLQEDEEQGQVPPEEEVTTRRFPVFDFVRRR